MPNKKLILTLALLIILGFFVYGRAINGKFIWDDEYLIQNNPQIKDLSQVLKLYSQDMGGKNNTHGYGFYRPLANTVYAVDYSFNKLNAGIYHLSSIIFHILAAFSICLLINLLLSNWPVALLTGILFLIHPAQTEAVAYISGLADPLAALFMALGLIFYIKYQSHRKRSLYCLALLTYLMALLSKETSLIFPALILLYHYVFKKKFRIKEFLPVLLMVFLYLFFRSAIAKIGFFTQTIPFWQVVIKRLPGFFAAIAGYTRILIFPFNLHMEYGNQLFKFYDYRAVVGLVITSGLICWGWLARKKDPVFLFSILWFFITLLPSSSIYPVNSFYMAEHWLYLPLAGFCLILARWLVNLYQTGKFKKLSLALTFSLILFWSTLTAQQCDYWNNPLTFYKRTLRYAPDSQHIYYNLGSIYGNSGQYSKAAAMYNKAIELNPDYTEAYDKLGSIYYYLGNYSSAIRMYKKAIALNPKYHNSYNNLGTTYGKIGDLAGAISMYRIAIQNDPQSAATYFNLAVTYLEMKEYDLAIWNCDQAIKLGYKIPPVLLKQLEGYKK
jgi:protein O-mannosyl-transferase